MLKLFDEDFGRRDQEPSADPKRLENMLMACMRATMESFRNPAFLLARNGKVLCKNLRGVMLLKDEQAGVFMSGPRVLTFSDRGVNAEFQGFLHEFVEGGVVSARRYVDQSLLLALRRWGVNLGEDRDQRAVVTLRWAGYECDLDEEEIAKVFKLRPMQARLAHALLNGGSLRSFARGANISRNTAKFHLDGLMPQVRMPHPNRPGPEDVPVAGRVERLINGMPMHSSGA